MKKISFAEILPLAITMLFDIRVMRPRLERKYDKLVLLPHDKGNGSTLSGLCLQIDGKQLMFWVTDITLYVNERLQTVKKAEIRYSLVSLFSKWYEEEKNDVVLEIAIPKKVSGIEKMKYDFSIISLIVYVLNYEINESKLSDSQLESLIGISEGSPIDEFAQSIIDFDKNVEKDGNLIRVSL
jgi:hypothetical protein